MNWRKPTGLALTFATSLLLCGASTARAGLFKITDVWYDTTTTSTSHLVKVYTRAKYFGKVDIDDKHALIKTSVRDTQGGSTTSRGENYRKPFYTGQVIKCSNETPGCPAHRYISKPCLHGHDEPEQHKALSRERQGNHLPSIWTRHRPPRWRHGAGALPER